MTATVTITIAEAPEPTANLKSDATEQRQRSKNASAQAKHRAKRKAYIKQLEDTVAKLEALLSQGTEEVTPCAQMRIHELEKENDRLKDKLDLLNVQLQQYPSLSPPKLASHYFACSSRNCIDVAHIQFPSMKVPTIINNRSEDRFPEFDPVNDSNDEYSSSGDFGLRGKRRKLVSTDSESSENTSPYLATRETGSHYRENSPQASHYSGQTIGTASNVFVYPSSDNRSEAFTEIFPRASWPSLSFTPSQESSDESSDGQMHTMAISLPTSHLTESASSTTHRPHVKDQTGSVMSTLTKLTNVMSQSEMESSTSAITSQFTMSLSKADYAPLHSIY